MMAEERFTGSAIVWLLIADAAALLVVWLAIIGLLVVPRIAPWVCRELIR